MPRAAFTSAVFDAFLQQGLWHVTVDDNVTGECLTADLIRQIVTRYRAQPGDAGAVQDMGLFALAMGVAEWGVIDPAGLPADPAGKRWKSDTGPDSGKHLMSYGIGGIGISHADVGDLEEFIRDVAEDRTVVPAEHAPALLRLADRDLYKPRNGRRQVIYDQIRAAGVCASQEFDTDLLGEPFRHFDNVGDGFRVLRRVREPKSERHRLARVQDLDAGGDPHQSQAGTACVPVVEGILGRVVGESPARSEVHGRSPDQCARGNSSPKHANRAIDQPATTIAERVQRELDQYGKFKMSTLQNWLTKHSSPVVLYPGQFASKAAVAEDNLLQAQA